ncbi:MAG: endolytic transglycosylase MltG [Arenicellales bacterium]
MRNIALRLLIPLLVVAVFGSVTGYWYFTRAVNKQLNLSDNTFVIERGETLNGIAQRLVGEGTLPEPWSLRLLAKQKGLGHSIQAGEYQFPESMNLREFLDRIVHGKGQVDVRVTIVEGWTFKQMREALKQAPRLRHLTAEWSDERIMEALGYPDLHPEGQFYPDTFHYRTNDTDLEILRKSFELMQQKLELAWQQRAKDLPLDDPYQALILASIIEKETQVREEQSTIAGVFMNRLKKGMRLQTDPTVIYGIGEDFDGDITREHLKTDTPYNTYTRGGLTPTPISLPGEDSLMATVKPSETDAFYFVAKGGGRHQFSKTLKEHNAAVRKYILGKSE